MKIPKTARRTARRLFRACFVNDQFSEEKARALVAEWVRRKPRQSLATLAVFQRLVRLELARHAAHVESAVALGDELRAQVDEGLRQLYRRPLTLQYHVNPALLGGLRIRVGSEVWDGTVANRLESLRAASARWQ